MKPLFLDDLHDLKRELRLSGIDHCDDVQAILERCVLDFRVGFVRKVGFDMVSTLQATTYTEDPTTPDEWRRAAARLIEIKSVWCSLVCVLPMHFADASGDDFQALNDEGVWRQMDSEDREQLVAKCRDEIAELYDIICSSAVQDESDIHVFDGTPDCTTSMVPPGGSVFCNARAFKGNFGLPLISINHEGQLSRRRLS